MKSRSLKAVKFQQDAQIFVWIVINIVFVAIHGDEIVILTTAGTEITLNNLALESMKPLHGVACIG